MTVVDQDLQFATVAAWRYEMLRKLGVVADDALRLSHRTDVDWHALERLIRHGCEPTLAVRIVE
jgi:hypothetical protein